ncbi:penicillin-binding protein activator LpoB [Helicobacter cinaedi]|uniref:Penicillin-binding protein activator LpoB n=1 Tax=Helicobacter cinaedi TaxID=213 RepID=A0A377JSF7_9HELI|nr:penicillin-binding protein activator LpoB [Helicobacter cinaedi]BDB64601.1 penicillin-binding protein activator LpoB [Helicobacter cinaedi]STP09508.1 putative lipoprotein [Helicobacter cinaedi]STP10910.1 putative lipoprotein [Helicobacter cinaedi]
MNKKLVACGVALSALLIAGCGGGPEYVDASNSKAYASMGLDYHDIEKAASDSVQSLLSSAQVREISQGGKKRVVMISGVINDTMQTIDTDQLSRKITRDMRNSGKFVLTLAQGAKTEKGIDMARSARDNDEFDQRTTIEKGNLKSAELSLSGKIVQKNTKVGSKQRTDYFFLLTLTNLKDGTVVWDDEVNIIKLGSNSSVTW